MAKANKGGRVEIIEIVVDGIKYTQTRPGYYFKRTEEGQRRIPKSEWEQAFEKYTAEQEQWDAEDEIAERKEVEEKKDRETEQNFNGKKEQPKAKKAAKPRRSKDIAWAGNGINAPHTLTLTAKQVDFIKHLPDTSFWEQGLDSMPWCDVLAEEIGGQFAGKPMTVGAMISTLREKGLVNVGKDLDRKGKPKFMVLTDLGKKVAKELGLE